MECQLIIFSWEGARYPYLSFPHIGRTFGCVLEDVGRRLPAPPALAVWADMHVLVTVVSHDVCTSFINGVSWNSPVAIFSLEASAVSGDSCTACYMH